MILKRKYKDGFSMDEYFCDLTEKLDECAYFDTKERPYYRHYLLDYKNTKDYCNFAIRVPGGTVGGIWVDKNNVITSIKVDTNYVVKTYSDELNDIIQKYIGEKIEFEGK